MDSFYQRYVYARIGSETSRRKACPPRLPSGFCLASCSHRIKDMPCLWSGEESFAGERGKMEEDLNICQTRAAEFCYASDFWLFLLVLGEGGLQTPFTRMCPNQPCNYHPEHAVQWSSSRQFKWKQCKLFPAYCAAQLQSKSIWSPYFILFFFLVFKLDGKLLEQQNRTRISDAHTTFTFPPIFERFPDCSRASSNPWD